jgi:predicted amidohydrolase YtcJ
MNKMPKGTKAYINGNIITMERGMPHASALVTKGNQILYLGSDDWAKDHIDSNTEVFDLKHHTVLPGLIDDHVHFLNTCINMRTVDLRECRSLTEIQEKLRKRIRNAEPGEWIQGHGFDHTTFTCDRKLPTRWDLDNVSTDHPIIIKRVCMHLVVANSLALDKTNIRPHQLINKKEAIVETGELNGIICEQDIELLLKGVPDIMASDALKKEILVEGFQKVIGCGLTSIRPCHVKALNLPDPIRLYHELDSENRLPVRVCVDSDELHIFGAMAYPESRKVKYGAYKLFVDGALGARTAALSDPYLDQPDSLGVLNHSQEQCNDLVMKAYAQGVQTAIHAIGDQGIDMAVSAMEYATSRTGMKPDYRFRLVHASVMRDDLFARLKHLPVVIDVQPSLMRQSIVWAEDRIGNERSRYLYAFKTLMEEGFCLAGGSDSPGEDMNPFLGIAYAVTRQNPDGYPKGGWYPDQRLSVHEALELYTMNAAYASFEEDVKGSLRPNKLADFIVIDKDILSLPPKDIHTIKVLATVCDGDLVYNHSFWS